MNKRVKLKDFSYSYIYQVSGEANEAQLIEALQQYYNRAVFVQRTLYHLFSITQNYTQPRLDIIKVSENVPVKSYLENVQKYTCLL